MVMDSDIRRNGPHTRRNRSFGGCGTCRVRRTKCDERQPTCTTCAAAKIKCSGYKKSIIFDDEKGSSYAESRFRRPLLTEEERRHESEALALSMPSELVLRRIAQIDRECERLLDVRSIDIIKGPFSAFTASSNVQGRESKREAQNSPSEGSTESVGPPVVGDVVGDLNDEIDVAFPTCSEIELFEPSDLDFSFIFGESFDMSGCRGDRNQSAFLGEYGLPWGVDNTRNIHDDILVPDAQQSSDDVLDSGDIDSIISTQFIDKEPHGPSHLSSIPYTTVSVPVPQDALYLLKHYSNTVLRVFTPFRHSKTPWHILFVPYVKGSLAALSLGEEVDHAGLATFYGTLAISASSLGNLFNSSRWKDQSAEYRRRALNHIHPMLQVAYRTPKSAKYKSMLMALLTMVQLYGISGDRDQFECYLLETEKLIRVKGLNRMKSRKVRLLHHCYVFERLIYESDLPGNVQSPQRQQIRTAIEISDSRGYSKDSLSFSLWESVDLDREIFTLKDQEKGENDLHLQIPGIWVDSLYPEIFGVSELHMTFLSMIIRLSRSRDSELYSTSTGLNEFMKGAKTIERGIHYLKRNINRQPVNIPDTDGSMQLMGSLGEVMALALSIYFYRILYDVEREMLQDKVRGVHDCLLRFETDESQREYGSVRLIWPAVVAAREAEDADLQKSFTQWFEISAQRTGLYSFTKALHDVERHWTQKSFGSTRVDTVK